VRVTGLGSWPGKDLAEAIDQVREAFPEEPFLPELPARGLGADMVGRSLGLIGQAAGFACEPTATGWATSSYRSRAQRAAWATLRDDLDIAADSLQDWAGPCHLSLAGPWTLAAVVGRGSREVLLADAGACRDLAGAWREAVAFWSRRSRHLMPETQWSFQIDEPLLPAVSQGAVPTLSGWGHHQAVAADQLAAAYQGLSDLALVEGWQESVVHCCAPGLALDTMARAGFTTVSLDCATLSLSGREQLADFCDRGGRVWLGVLPTGHPADALPSRENLVSSPRRLLADLGLDPRADQASLTPACGLAGFSVAVAGQVGRLLRQVAQSLTEEGL